MQGDDLPKLNAKLQSKYNQIQMNEVMYEEFMTEDADILITAFRYSCKGGKKCCNRSQKNWFEGWII